MTPAGAQLRLIADSWHAASLSRLWSRTGQEPAKGRWLEFRWARERLIGL